MAKMKPERRKAELLQGLRATTNSTVYVAVNHVAEVLGIEKAAELHQEGTLVEQSEATRVRTLADGSKQVTQALYSGNAAFDRETLLEALEAHQFPAATLPQKTQAELETEKKQQELNKQEKKEPVSPSPFPPKSE